MKPPPNRASTAPVSPASPQTPFTPNGEKKAGFLRRHFHRRRSSVITVPQLAIPQPPAKQQQQQQQQQLQQQQQQQQQQQHQQLQHRPPPSQPPTSAHSFTQPPLSADSKHTSDDSKHDSLEKPESAGRESVETDEFHDPPRSSSKSSGMVRFAPGLDLPPAARPRRTSSAGTAGTGRRGSIYQRFQGGYTDGVDAGVGSKARTLSVAIPHELYVDECRLAEHFSVLSRAGKKDIGEGGAAVVHLMQSKTAGPGKVFAVKAFRDWEPDEELEREYVRKIKSEYAIAKSLEHPNIIQTYRLCHSDKKWFHVMEYCDLGDLNDLINKGYFSREDRNCMFKQLLRGVEYLHSRGIAHRDLKSENLLLTSTGCLKLADFGTAEVFSGMHPGLRGCRRQSLVKEEDEVRLCAPGLVGSRPYMAPEIIEHEDQYDPRAVDIWSCAIVYLTLCIGGTPWEFASTDVKNYNIFCSTWDTWYERYPDRLLTKERVLPAFAYTKQFAMLDDMGTKCLVMGMLHPDPSKRWSAKDVLESKTVVDYPCCQQDGYSDDIKTRQRKAMHNHCPPKPVKGSKFLKPK